MPNPVAIILAAGQGSRFRAMAGNDQNKLLAPCRGLSGIERPVLEHVLINLGKRIERRLVITRPQSTDVIALARAYDCEVLLLDSSGMGDSLAAAVAASAEASGWLVVLGDMPFIHPDTYLQVVQSIQAERIVVPVFNTFPGHPVGFGQTFIKPLSALRGDRGARGLCEADKVIQLSVEDAGIHRDIDLPTALSQ
jgi:molybdenum cofactor cytidylyltransferase